MDKRQGFWWAASLTLLGVWALVCWFLYAGAAEEVFFWVYIPLPIILTVSHWLNRPGAGDAELEELTMEAKKARLRSEIASHQKD